MTDKWAALQAHHATVADRPVPALFQDDPGRAEGFSTRADGMLFDWSKTGIDASARALLLALAEASDVAGRRAAMFGGDKINDTEGRAVLHVALRAADDARIVVDGVDVMPGVRASARADRGLCPRRALGRLSGARRADHRCGQHRYRRVRPWPGHGDTCAGAIP